MSASATGMVRLWDVAAASCEQVSFFFALSVSASPEITSVLSVYRRLSVGCPVDYQDHSGSSQRRIWTLPEL